MSNRGDILSSSLVIIASCDAEGKGVVGGGAVLVNRFCNTPF